jgi:hypothetical protein
METVQPNSHGPAPPDCPTYYCRSTCAGMGIERNASAKKPMNPRSKGRIAKQGGQYGGGGRETLVSEHVSARLRLRTQFGHRGRPESAKMGHER